MASAFFPNLVGARACWRSDLSAGLVVGIIALPLAMAFGVAAFSPLGSSAASFGALAGMLGAILTGFFASLFGGCRSQVTGPTAPMSIVTRTTLAGLLASPALLALEVEQAIGAALMLLSITVLLGGITEVLLAVTRVGRLIRYIPYPVVAGFMNGISVLILLSQLRPGLGLPGSAALSEIWQSWSRLNTVALFTSLSTIFIIIVLPRLTKRAPASLLALIVGTLLFYLAAFMLAPALLSPANPLVVGPIPPIVSRPALWLSFDAVLLAFEGDIAQLIIQQGLILGVMGTIDTLLTSVVADFRTATRHNSDRELVGQGIGNIVSGLLGGLPGAGATVRTIANIELGGRSGLAGMIHAVILLLILLILGPLAQWIPLSVLAGILVVMAARMVDFWSLELLKKRSAREDSFVLWTVTAVTVAVDLIIAVGIGLALAALLYVKNQSLTSPVRRMTDGRTARSRRIRPETEELVLAEHRSALALVELEGSLFFGTVDDLVTQLESELREAKAIVIDIHRIRTIDLSGGRALIEIFEKWCQRDVWVALSGLPINAKYASFLEELGLERILMKHNRFSDMDHALEAAEQYLLSCFGGVLDKKPSWNFLDFLNDEQAAKVVQACVREEWAEGQLVFSAGDKVNGIFGVINGEVSLYAVDQGGNTKRMVVYGAGQTIGGQAWLEGRPHAYSALATTPAITLRIPSEQLNLWLEQETNLARGLLMALARLLSRRLRRIQAERDALGEIE